MHGTTFAAAAAVLLSALPAAYAGKQAIIHNNCDFDVYVWSVDEDRNPDEPTTISVNGGVYSEPYYTPQVGGVSMKVSPHPTLDIGITQLEYTNELPAQIWYDVSNVDCTGDSCPFQKYGLHLHSAPGCPTVNCIAGNETCHGAYTLWDDNWASLCCEDPEADVNLYLCQESGEPPYAAPAPAPPAPKVKPPPTSSIVPDVADAGVTPEPKKVKPIVEEPYVETAYVTEYSTATVVTTTKVLAPTGGASRHHARHVHQHNHGLAHHHH